VKAFVFSSIRDREAAHLCADRLEEHGAAVAIVLPDNEGISDARPRELFSSFRRRGRLFGSECSAGIAATMVEHCSGHDVVAKIDADTLVRQAGFDWLAKATERAHGFQVNQHSWLGIWAAPVKVLLRAADVIQRNKCQGCAESSIFGVYFQNRCGRATPPPAACQVWRAGRPIRDDAWIVTLPSGLPGDVRAALCRELLSAPAMPIHAESAPPTPSLRATAAE
jgi:hypothetical protein